MGTWWIFWISRSPGIIGPSSICLGVFTLILDLLRHDRRAAPAS
jgi:hypothetical protein